VQEADASGAAAAATEEGNPPLASFFAVAEMDPFRERLMKCIVNNYLSFTLLEDPDFRACLGQR
jgi:hypothetical protein